MGKKCDCSTTALSQFSGPHPLRVPRTKVIILKDTWLINYEIDLVSASVSDSAPELVLF
jgi:hypothetical protein